MDQLHRYTGSFALLLLMLALTGCAPNEVPDNVTGHQGATASDHLHSLQLLPDLPLRFEQNHGQSDAAYDFIHRGDHVAILVSTKEMVMYPTRSPRGEAMLAGIKMQFEGVSAEASIAGTGKLPGRVNYFVGEPENWHTGVATYNGIKIADIYRNIDLEFHGRQQQLEYDFVVRPGGVVEDIQIGITGTDEMYLDTQGNLMLVRGDQLVMQRRPVIYQRVNNTRVPVKGRFRMLAASQGVYRIGFEVAAYLPEHDLVIDPILDYASLIGGDSEDEGVSIAVDDSGSAYIAGTTRSMMLPAAGTRALLGSQDVFVSKLDPSGAYIEFTTYLGGSGLYRPGREDSHDSPYDEDDNEDEPGFDEEADWPDTDVPDRDAVRGMVLGDDGSLYLTGITSSNLDFPVVNAVQPEYGGGQADAFLTRLAADGNTILFSTYLGGDRRDKATAIALTQAGDPVVTGMTRSADFPLNNSIPLEQSGKQDIFLSRVDRTGTQLEFSVRLGGSRADMVRAITVDNEDNLYLAGWTRSNDGHFSDERNTKGTRKHDKDAFVMQLDSQADYIRSWKLGGSKNDAATDIALTRDDDIVITGWTRSRRDFPVTGQAIQPAYGGGQRDAFISILTGEAGAIAYSSYLGGSRQDRATGMALSSAGTIWIMGDTRSVDFPVTDTSRSSHNKKRDMFISQLSADATGLLFSEYFGGTRHEHARGIVTDSMNGIYVTGSSRSSKDFPVLNAIQPYFSGGKTDAFVARFVDESIIINRPPEIISTPVTAASVNVPYYYQVAATDPDGSELVYSLVHAPDGMEIDPLTGLVSWVPETAGVSQVTVRVMDAQGASAEQEFELTVSDLNNNPLINSVPALTAVSGQPYFTLIDAIDPDDDPLTYTLEIAPAGMVIEKLPFDPFLWFLSNPGSPVLPGPEELDDIPVRDEIVILSWVPANSGEYPVALEVSDNRGGSTRQSFTITVEQGPLPPDIISAPVTEGIEGVGYRYPVQAVLEGKSLRYALLEGPPGMSMDSDSGILVWEIPVAGTYTVSISVSVTGNQELSAFQSYELVVLTLAEADTLFRGLWDDLFADLAGGQLESVNERLTTDAQVRYGPVLETLSPYADEIRATYAPLQRLAISPGLAEYATAIMIDGRKKIFFISYLKNSVGKWKIGEM